MRGIVGGMRHWAWAATPLLAFVLLFRMLIPAGYMIGADVSGRPRLVVCGAIATSAPPMHDHHGHPAAPAPAKAHEPPCAYAALGAPPLPPAAPAFLPPPLAAEAPPVSAPIENWAQADPAAAPPPATGPPSQV